MGGLLGCWLDITRAASGLLLNLGLSPRLRYFHCVSKSI